MNYFANEVANVAQAVQEAESYLPGPISEKPDKVTIGQRESCLNMNSSNYILTCRSLLRRFCWGRRK